MSVTALAASYLLYMSKVRRYTVSRKLLKTCISWTSLKMIPSRDTVSFAHLDDWLRLFLDKKHTNAS